MTISREIELLARMWMVCDPNRSGSDPDEIMGQMCEQSSNGDSRSYDTPLTGKPRWHWFIPRAEATVEYLRSVGIKLTDEGFASSESAR